MGSRQAGLRYGSPGEAGLSAESLRRARELAAASVEDGTHPALEVLVARRGVIALHEAFGRHGPAPEDPPLKCGDLMPTASMIKPVTAAALMALVEDGRVGLTRPVSEYIPEFTGGGREAVYVHHLLTHTSGLSLDIQVTSQQVLERLHQPRRHADVSHIEDTLLQVACDTPLVGGPGREMRYDTLNYELLGEIVRRVSGRPLQDFIGDRILGPLGMEDTWYALPKELRERVVTANIEGNPTTAVPLIGVGSGSGASGSYSTALDMARFAQMFLDRGQGPRGQVLHPGTVAAMSVNQIPGIPGGFPEERHDEASWSFGWGVACHERWQYFPTFARGVLQHGGAVGTILWVDPATELVGVYMSLAEMNFCTGILRWCADLFVNVVQTAVQT